MKTAFQYLVTASILAALAVAVAAAGRVDRRLARAEQRIATFAFDDAEAAYAELERSLDAAGFVPGVFGGARAGLEARRAALRYWRGDYAGLLADYADASAPGVTGNPALQFVLAAAAARAALDPGAGREQALRALDGAIDVYLGVLQDGAGQLDAAYNYEYPRPAARGPRGGGRAAGGAGGAGTAARARHPRTARWRRSRSTFRCSATSIRRWTSRRPSAPGSASGNGVDNRGVFGNDRVMTVARIRRRPCPLPATGGEPVMVSQASVHLSLSLSLSLSLFNNRTK